MKYSENSKEIRDGKRIFFRSWLPDEKIAGMIILIHGLGEHSQRYGSSFADFFTRNHIGIKAFDLPGHGLSYGKKGDIDDPILVLEVIDEMINEVKGQFPEVPLFIYGQSFGGEIGLWYDLARYPKVNGVIITSPLIGPKDPVPAAKLFLAKTMDKLYPSFSMDNGLSPNDLSRDKSIVNGYVGDPLVHPLVSARTGMMIINRGQWIMENAADNTNNLLIMFGDGENIVNPDPIIKFSKTAPHTTLKIWPGLFHEIHNEPEKEEVFDYTLDWIKSKSTS